LGEPQDRFLNVSPLSLSSHFISPLVLLLTRRFFTRYLSHSIRETDAPLTGPPKQPFVFSGSDPTPDGGLTAVDAQPPLENPSNPPFDGNGARMVPRSAPLYSGSSAPSSGQMDAGPPLIGVECPTGAPPSQPTCPIEISSRGFDPSPSTLEPELRPDHDVCTNAGGHLAAPSISCGADATPDGRPPSNSPSAEATRIDGPPSFDAPISDIHSHANDSAGGVSTFDTKCKSSETRGDELSRSAPPFTWEHPVEHSPQAGPAFPSPSKSVHPNANFPSGTAATAISVSCASENLPLPRPPPEVAALLSAQSSGRAVSPILARDSPLVRWELPSAIGYFWLGFFWISAVKVIFMSAYLSEKTISIHRESFFLFLGGNTSTAKKYHVEGVKGPHGATYLALFSRMGARRRGPAQGRVDAFHAAVVGTGASPAAKPTTLVQAL
jgi:hypothetical protein